MDFNSGKDIKEWRTINKFTQQKLADEIGYSKDRIAHIESKDEILTKKLKHALTALDKRKNPAPPIVISSWQKIERYNAERRNYYDKELIPLGQNIARILNEIPNKKRLDHTVSYLNLLNIWMKTLICLIDLQYTDENDYRKKEKQYLTYLKNATWIYKKKQENKK